MTKQPTVAQQIKAITGTADKADVLTISGKNEFETNFEQLKNFLMTMPMGDKKFVIFRDIKDQIQLQRYALASNLSGVHKIIVDGSVVNDVGLYVAKKRQAKQKGSAHWDPNIPAQIDAGTIAARELSTPEIIKGVVPFGTLSSAQVDEARIQNEKNRHQQEYIAAKPITGMTGEAVIKPPTFWQKVRDFFVGGPF